jgi:hypothetical protein
VKHEQPSRAVVDYMEGLRTHDIAKIGRSFAKNLRFVTPVRSIDARHTLLFLTSLYTGFPDWHYENDPPALQPTAHGV